MSEAPGECDPSLEGVVLARVHDLADRGTLSIQTDGGLLVLLIRSKGMIRAFVNACPHHDLPLDYRGPNVLSADGMTIRCTNHDAAFSIEDGAGTSGLGSGCRLDVLPIAIGADGVIRLRSDGTNGSEGRWATAARAG
jgi:nitrite reductase/ring-hydroxylating ferredoxin subunit